MKLRSWIRPLAFILLALLTLLALAVTIENVRGKRAFLACQRDLESRGESLDWKTFVPPPVPDNQNFAATPLLAPLRDYLRDPATREIRYRRPERQERLQHLFNWRRDFFKPNAWRKGEFANLASAQRELRLPTNASDPHVLALQARPAGSPAEDLLFLLQQNESEFDEIRAALLRPRSTFLTPDSADVDALLPKLTVLKSFASAFQLRALAELALGRPDAALSQVKSCFDLSDTLQHEPLLISALVRIALLDLAFQPLWEGAARHQWTDAHLGRAQDRLARLNLIDDFLDCLRGERAFSVSTLAAMKAGNPAATGSGETAFPFAGLLKHAPSGWVYQNQLAIARTFEEFVLPAYRSAEHRIVVTPSTRLEEDLNRRFPRSGPYSIFARLLLPAVGRAANRAARAQATVDLALVACALERHRLQHAHYPASLDALIPHFLPALPPDVVTGQPLHYRVEPSGQAVLYSAGLDGQDNGGTVLLKRQGDPDLEQTGTDWVWLLPPPPSPAPLSSSSSSSSSSP